ncbi:hypothetical protein [Streptomyces albireticuli]|uniref:hypothetical protein n=1 Tax=Streptomyces albireticuli TaxID=1940 RepID=UPI0036CE1308
MNGLYALNPWYAARLGGPRAALARRGVSPDTLTAAGVLSAAGAGAALAPLPAPLAAAPVASLLAARLAFADLAPLWLPAVVAAATDWAVPVLVVVAVGSALTALFRPGWLWRELGEGR